MFDCVATKALRSLPPKLARTTKDDLADHFTMESIIGEWNIIYELDF